LSVKIEKIAIKLHEYIENCFACIHIYIDTRICTYISILH